MNLPVTPSMIKLEDYFEKGYSITSVPANIMSKLWMEIYSVEWLPSSSSVYKSTPAWYTPSNTYPDLVSGGDQQNSQKQLPMFSTQILLKMQLLTLY